MDPHKRKSTLRQRQTLDGEGIGTGQQIADRTACRDIILRILPPLRIAHHLPGRIRLQLKSGRFSLAAVGNGDVAEAIRALRELLPGIHAVRLNRLAASVLLNPFFRRA